MMLAIVFALLVTPVPSGPPRPPTPAPAPMRVTEAMFPTQPVVLSGLTALTALLDTTTYAALGFKSLKEIESAQPGIPMARFIVPLVGLRNYQPAMDPAQLLIPSDVSLYPIEVSGAARSSIAFAKLAGFWRPVAFGNPHLISALDQIRAQDSKATQTPISSYFVVAIPALETVFLGVNTPAEIDLIPVFTDKLLGLHAGMRMPARDVFAQLAPFAQRYNGLPT